MPTWRDYYLGHDQTPHYEYLKQVLQVLTWLRGGERWVLKSPQHCEQIRPLLNVFPDATFVVTHRDPVSVTASVVTMLTYAARMSVAHPDPVVYGPYWSQRVEDLLHGCERDRDLIPDGQAIDVRFHEFMADDFAMVERIYAVAGQPMTAAARAGMEAFLAAHPRGQVRDRRLRPRRLRHRPRRAPPRAALLRRALRHRRRVRPPDDSFRGAFRSLWRPQVAPKRVGWGLDLGAAGSRWRGARSRTGSCRSGPGRSRARPPRSGSPRSPAASAPTHATSAATAGDLAPGLRGRAAAAGGDRRGRRPRRGALDRQGTAFRDARVTDASRGEAALHLLVRIPLATALVEELVFRGVILGFGLRDGDRRRALARQLGRVRALARRRRRCTRRASARPVSVVGHHAARPRPASCSATSSRRRSAGSGSAGSACGRAASSRRRSRTRR